MKMMFQVILLFNHLGSVNSESLLFKKQLFTDSSCVLWGCDTVAFCPGVCENFIVIPSLEAEENLILFNIEHSHKKRTHEGKQRKMNFFQGLAVIRLSKHQHCPCMSTDPQNPKSIYSQISVCHTAFTRSVSALSNSTLWKCCTAT